MKRLGSTVCLIILLGLSPFTAADTFHRWVDEDGVTHYSKIAPSGRTSETINIATGTTQPTLSTPTIGGTTETESSADEVQARWCQQHAKNLEVLKNKDRVQQQDPETGETHTLTEGERAKMIRQIEAQLDGC